MEKKWYIHSNDDEDYDDGAADEQENLPGSDGPEGP